MPEKDEVIVLSLAAKHIPNYTRHTVHSTQHTAHIIQMHRSKVPEKDEAMVLSAVERAVKRRLAERVRGGGGGRGYLGPAFTYHLRRRW